jgi:hypothetical protein
VRQLVLQFGSGLQALTEGTLAPGARVGIYAKVLLLFGIFCVRVCARANAVQSWGESYLHM